ncbi:DNA-binding transcriptional regulator, XRE-family HTH domain [Planococcus glaciei]|uniref:helix-turn-helix domain-containing protein n=1 Tax=Planococcus glaciei TaxID=459472 RepID=UPI000886340A|nr:helix-turn-helix transcriptional regulator [Planococcus glaciei]SDH35331.1 DNA-binding transcriptional regulator, XRE-family HTH domain [Planococcus glaciei]
MPKLSENLKLLREKNKLTQQIVAQHLKITKAIYSKFETGGAEPHLKLLVKMADLYNVSLDELAGRQFTPNGKVIDQLIIKREMTKEINSMVKQIANEFIQSKEADIVKRVKQKFNLS